MFSVEELKRALANEEIVPYFQPQYNHASGLIVGAEALARWIKPEGGMVSPVDFIPAFEENNLITELDLHIFESACREVKKLSELKYPLVPISVNISRLDIMKEGFADKLDEIRRSYDISVKSVHIELTESIIADTAGHVAVFVEQMHKYGYTIEMDDFGSGYSSLNLLKDIPFDVLKLDMDFMRGRIGGRGGIIISSVVRMAKWLSMPVIAEGIETVEQADYMLSVGCDYIQGFLYSKPLPSDEYEKLFAGTHVGKVVPHIELVRKMDAEKFWDPESLETLIYNSYVGSAAIFSYQDGYVEFQRVNKKYLAELGMNLTEQDVIRMDFWDSFDQDAKTIYQGMLRKAIMSEQEQECETWRTIKSGCCGEETLCIRTTVRLIGKGEDEYIFYATTRNVTGEKRRYTELTDTERRFKQASEQANIYFWEYTVATREMRPCFRCMRDLGLPALVTNYPEPAIEMGIFPEDYADMYRDWHKQIAEGAESLEAIIPLTVGRVPFHVRYTTEFDENGRPIKAYGSATLVVD